MTEILNHIEMDSHFKILILNIPFNVYLITYIKPFLCNRVLN